jgi:hypothetical protein
MTKKPMKNLLKSITILSISSADLDRSGSTTNHLSLCRRHHETGVSV